ncbi:hypothetical protein C8R44DRAFT_724893 [Mycena epipterygia]|nr:hypothetical protein C8R44DRAFT_724893 [Mycena epipterygia]
MTLHKSNKPVLYLQLRQLVLSAVLPVHTHKEYITFKTHINHQNFWHGTTAPPHEAWKNIAFTNLHNSGISLLTKTILWSSERSTLADGINFAGHKPLLDLLNSDENYVDALPVIPLPDGELELSISDSIVPISFDRMSALPASGGPSNSAFTGNESSDMDSITFDNTFQPPQVELKDAEMSMEIGPLQTTALSALLVKPAQYQILLPGAALPTAENESSKSGDCCAVCTKAYCEKWKE